MGREAVPPQGAVKADAQHTRWKQSQGGWMHTDDEGCAEERWSAVYSMYVGVKGRTCNWRGSETDGVVSGDYEQE